MLSLLLGLAAKTFFGFWLALEVNILIFTGILRINTKLSVSTLIYFIPQSLTSATLLFLVFLRTHTQLRLVSLCLIPAAIFMKLGLAPLHIWFIQISPLLRRYIFFMISTTQKILPLFLAAFLAKKRLPFFLAVSVLVARISALAHKRIPLILAFSSIFSGCWILASAKITHGLAYFWLYTISLAIFLLRATSPKVETLGDIWSLPWVKRASLMVAIFALIGIPPTAIFIGKLFVLLDLITTKNWMLAASLLITSFIFFWAYARILFSQAALRQKRLRLIVSTSPEFWGVRLARASLIRAPWILLI